jgi:hypothetical protein
MLMVVLGAGASHDSTHHYPAGWGMGYPNDGNRLELKKSLMAVRHYIPYVVGRCEESWCAAFHHLHHFAFGSHRY